MKKPTLGSLFDGSGGFPLAAAMCGIEPVWASEVEPYPIAVTKTHLPKMKHLGSVTDIDGGKVEPVNIITFGSPCQDLSVAGKRAGLKHEANGDDETTRSGLFMEAVRIIKEMREATDGRYPNVAVWENVPGAFSSNRGEDFRTVLEELIKIVEPTAVMPEVPKGGWAYADCYVGDGWSLAYRVLDAQYIRTAQRRRRIFLVLHLTGERAEEILFERESLRGDSPTCGAQGKAVARNAADGIGADDREGAVDVIPINTMVATRHKQLGRDTGFGVGEVGDPQFTISAGHEHACAYSFYPQMKSVCLVNGSNPGFQNGVVAAAGFKAGQSKAGGIGWQEECAATLYAQCSGTEPSVCVYDNGIVLDDQGGQQITVRNDDKSPTLRAETHGHPPCVVYDTRGNGNAEVVPTVTGDHENLVTDYTAVVAEPVYCLQGNGIDRADTAGCNGRGWNDETCYTLNTIDRPAVAYSMSSKQQSLAVSQDISNTLGANDYKEPQAVAYRQGGYADYVENEVGTIKASGGDLGGGSENLIVENNANVYGIGNGQAAQTYLQEKIGTLNCMHDQQAILIDNSPQYIVRRLTPVECARLQGFSDCWGDIEPKDDFTDEEYYFWLNVRNTHAAINGKSAKKYTKEQMLRWYNKLHTDSSEYKMWGNGVALPCVQYVMDGIADALRKDGVE